MNEHLFVCGPTEQQQSPEPGVHSQCTNGHYTNSTNGSAYRFPFSGSNSGSKENTIRHPLYRLIHDEPNPEMTSFVFRETLMTHLLLYGNAYAQICELAKKISFMYCVYVDMPQPNVSKGQFYPFQHHHLSHNSDQDY